MDIPELNAENGAELLAGIGAVNVGAQEAFNTTFITDLVGSGNAGLVAMGFGVAGAAAVASKLDVIDLEN